MSVLKNVGKEEVRFLMDFDYNNVLGRLKYVLGQEASFFADIRIRQNDITWSTKNDIEFKPFCDASETEKHAIKTMVDAQIESIKNKISSDSLIADFAQLITTYPSDQFVYFAQINGNYQIVLTGWGCRDALAQASEQNINQDSTENSNVLSNKKQPESYVSQSLTDGVGQMASSTSMYEQKTKVEEFYINDNIKNNPVKQEKKYSKNTIIKSVILILMAVFIALILPLFLTGALNRIVADITHQWYLNATSRIIITIIVTIITYSIAYILIRFTTFKKSVIFNVICFILTFIWSVCIGIMLMP